MESEKKKFPLKLNFKFNLSSSKDKDKDANDNEDFKINLNITKRIKKLNEVNKRTFEEDLNEEDDGSFKIKIPKLEHNYSKVSVSKNELLERDADGYNKINNVEHKGILQGKEETEEEDYFEKYFYFTYKELNEFEETLDNIFTTGIKLGKKYQIDVNNKNNYQKTKINLKNYKIDPDRIFKNQNFIKNLNEYKKIIHQNYSFWLTDSEIYNFYSHFKNFNFFKKILLTQNEILYSYISYLKNKKLEIIKETFN